MILNFLEKNGESGKHGISTFSVFLIKAHCYFINYLIVLYFTSNTYHTLYITYYMLFTSHADMFILYRNIEIDFSSGQTFFLPTISSTQYVRSYSMYGRTVRTVTQYIRSVMPYVRSYSTHGYTVRTVMQYIRSCSAMLSCSTNGSLPSTTSLPLYYHRSPLLPLFPSPSPTTLLPPFYYHPSHTEGSDLQREFGKILKVILLEKKNYLQCTKCRQGMSGCLAV
jgi:hypothetical protein